MKDLKTENVLIIGIGNYGRRDDGLGWYFLDLLEENNSSFDIEYRYQLQIEDADLIRKYDIVVFVDATIEDLADDFLFSPLKKEFVSSFTSHSIPPCQILYLCEELYNSCPEAYLLAIKGFEFNLQQGLTNKAKECLDNTWRAMKNKL